MKTFIEKLTEIETLKKQNIEKNGGFGMRELPHLLEVLDYLKQFRQEKNRVTEQTVYNSELLEYITEKENIPEHLKNILETQIYFAQQDFRKELELEYKNKMLNEGWLPLTNDIEYRGKIEYVAIRNSDFFTVKLANTGTVTETNDGKDLFLIPKGKRSRGYYIRTLEQAFYKVI
jgi:predicted RNase H-like nuclease (RuvC/YqgF family)